MRLIHTIGALLVLVTPLVAQEAPATSVGTRGGQNQAAPVRSPEVLADGRVTFRLLAPKATEVLVEGNWDGGRGLAMTRDASGLWSVTTAALQPELWAYTFSVDGVRTLDPRNYNVVRDGVGFMNTVIVPGEGSAVLQARPVPHGTMTTMWFQSMDQALRGRARVAGLAPRARRPRAAAVPIARHAGRAVGAARRARTFVRPVVAGDD
jgi:hypothetical protein